MPSLIPVALRSGLSYEPLEPDATELVEAGCDETPERTAKRRRIERIATRYLSGKRPIILSAGLRGPFNNDWANPWRAPSKEEKVEIRLNGEDIDVDNETARSLSNAKRQERGNHGPSEHNVRSRRTAPESGSAGVASGRSRSDVSRNRVSGRTKAHTTQDTEDSGHTDRRGEQQGKEHSNPFWLKRRSKHAGKDMFNDRGWSSKSSPTPTPSGVHNRRHTTLKTTPAHQQTHNSNSAMSDPGARDPDVASRLSTQGTELSYASPHMAKKSARSRGSHVVTGNDRNVIAKPAAQPPSSLSTDNTYRHRGSNYTIETDGHKVDSIRRTVDRGVKHHTPYQCDGSSENVAESGPTSRAVANSPTNLPRSSTKDRLGPMGPGDRDRVHSSESACTIEEPMIQIPKDHSSAVKAVTRGAGADEQNDAFHPLNDDQEYGSGDASIHQIGRPQSPQEAHSSCRQYKSDRVKIKTTSLPVRSSQDKSRTPAPICTHTHIASPARASSTGFAYRKTKQTGANKGKRRSASAKSTSTVRADSNAITSQGSQETSTVNLSHENESAKPQDDQESGGEPDDQESMLEVVQESHNISSHSGNDESQRSSRLSNFSTQAAMALAHLEFQEDYVHSPNSEADTTMSDHVEKDAQRRVSGEGAPIMSFHKLNEEVDHAMAEEEMGTFSPDRHMSTQDLFRTASPFAFSTVKKRPARNSLRFTIISEEGNSFADGENGSSTIEISTLSPEKDVSTWSVRKSSAGDRLPLKDKNGRGGLRRSSGRTDRASVLSCENPSPVPKQTAASCLDIDLDAGLECADRFLKSVGGIDLLQM